MARASPITAVAAVDALGTRSYGSASWSTPTSRRTSASRHSVELPAQPVMATTATPRSLTTSTNLHTSAVSPEFEMAMTASPVQTAPASPCRASAACTNSALVPVLDSVAASLAPTRPDFPRPVTTTRPEMRRSRSTAASASPNRSGSRPMPLRAWLIASIPARIAAPSEAGSAGRRLDALTGELVDVDLPGKVIALSGQPLHPQVLGQDLPPLVGAVGCGHVRCLRVVEGDGSPSHRAGHRSRLVG